MRVPPSYSPCVGGSRPYYNAAAGHVGPQLAMGPPYVGVGCIEDTPGCGERTGPNAVFYAGPGQGTYQKETIYKYVGHGGDFNLVVSRYSWSCIISYGVCCALLGLVGLLLFWPFGGKATTLIFDCNEDVLQWRIKWSGVKQAYCCDFTGRGCLPSQVSASTSGVPPQPGRAAAPAVPLQPPPPAQALAQSPVSPVQPPSPTPPPPLPPPPP